MMRAKIRDFIESNLNVYDEADFTDSDNIFETGFVDSMFALQLVQFVEAEFDVSVENTDLDLTNFQSIDAIAGFVTKKRS
jgi:acyl carrier protein